MVLGGVGKSFIISIFCVVKCILFPETKVVIASGTRNQARLIISEKIQQIYNSSANLKKEVAKIDPGINNCKVTFHNGSTITAVTSSDSSRGYRANVLILEEFRMIDKDILESVLKPFKNGAYRKPNFTHKPEYKDYLEDTQEIYISSAWYANDWIFEEYKAYLSQMLKGKNYFLVNTDYKLAIEHGLLTQKDIDDEKSKPTFNEISFLMEYESVFYSQNENAFFNLTHLNNVRTLKKAFMPLNRYDNYDEKALVKWKKDNIPKQANEIRIVGLDVAVSNKTGSDTSVFTCMRLIPEGDEYIRHVVYIETMMGEKIEEQAIRLRELFDDFDADYIVLDCMGVGIGVYQMITKVLYSENRGKEWKPLCSMNNESMNEKVDKDALPIVYTIKADAELNHNMAISLKSAVQNKKLRLLMNDIEAKEKFVEKGLLKKSTDEQVETLKPFVQTTALVNELVNLEYEIRSGKIKIKEVGNATKDRYSSVAYSNYFANILEQDLRKDDNKGILDYCMF